MKLLKTTFFSAIITIVRISSGFVASKIIAVTTGPSGVALIGAFSNFVSIVLNLGNGAINNGVVKYTAEYDDDDRKLKSLLSTSARISIICSGIVGLPLIIFGEFISRQFFKVNIYASPIRVLGATVVLYSLNTLLISILNGKSQIKTFTIVNTISTVVGLISTVVLVLQYKLIGALYSLVISQSIAFIFTFFFFVRSDWFSWGYFKEQFNWEILKNLTHYTTMSIVSMIMVPVTQLILRNILIDKINLQSAGYWQGMIRVSDGFLMVITTAMSTYYLPKLSALKGDKEVREEIFYGAKLILPTVAAGAVVVYILRFFVIRILFTREFIPMEGMFAGQLIGDIIKMATWILSYLMLARALTKAFIICEIVFSITYIAIAYVSIDLIGLNGITIAYAINNLMGLACLIFLFRKIVFH